MPTTIITTSRLLLRSALRSDFDQLFTLIFSDGEVMKHLAGSPLAREQAAKFFNDAFDHAGTGLKPGVLVELQTEKLLGYAWPHAVQRARRERLRTRVRVGA